MTKRMYRLPDGNETTDEYAYVGAWRDLVAPLESLIGVEHIAFDPGVQLLTKDGRSVDLPTWFVQRINQGLAKMGHFTAEKEE